MPGDKSISHRAVILGALARGQTHISNLLEADDVMRTAAAVRAFGAQVERDGDEFVVTGQPWRSPEKTVYCGNSGTGVRLLMGAAAGQGVTASFEGDASLRKRPMERILTPLRQMGVTGESREGQLPVTIAACSPKGIEFQLPTPSAQLKTAVLLAGLGACGDTIVEEPVPCRDHTEKMLPAFGADLTVTPKDDGRVIHLKGRAELHGIKVAVPGDPSSAAFLIVATLIVPGSEVIINGMLMNPTRIGFIEALQMMGADLTIINERSEGGEDVADIIARYGPLKAVTIAADKAPALIDEYPILSIAAAFAEGTSRFEGLEELRVKESDRLSATEALLSVNGVTCRSGDDWLEIDGGAVEGGGHVLTHHDHRIAMSALILGLASSSPVEIDDSEMIATSFPNFLSLMNSLGANIARVP